MKDLETKKVDMQVISFSASSNVETYFKKFGIKLNIPLFYPTDNSWLNHNVIELTKQQFGVFAPIFDSVNIHPKIAVEFESGNIYVELSYKYQHPSGSNGYTVMFKFDDLGNFINKTTH